jgi:hypothetical protein
MMVNRVRDRISVTVRVRDRVRDKVRIRDRVKDRVSSTRSLVLIYLYDSLD